MNMYIYNVCTYVFEYGKSISASRAMSNAGATTTIRIGLATMVAIVIRMATSAAGNVVFLKSIIANITNSSKVSGPGFSRRHD